MRKQFWFGVCALLALALLALAMAPPLAAAEKRVLVYTRNYTPDGKGYVHANIADSVAAIRKLGAEHGFAVEHSDDPAVFTEATLKTFDAIVFSNSNNEAFATDAQRAAFQAYIRNGGGFVGIHSATGSERKWEWYWKMIGGSFDYHPPLQKFTVRVVNPAHPATKNLPASFEWEDEFYFQKHTNPDVKPLLVGDPESLKDAKKAERPKHSWGNAMPLAWYHHFEGGRVFYTALGHKNEHYQDPLLLRQILGGIQWAMDRTQKELSQ